jgi:hypothetical protein
MYNFVSLKRGKEIGVLFGFKCWYTEFQEHEFLQQNLVIQKRTSVIIRAELHFKKLKYIRFLNLELVSLFCG